MGCDHGYLLGLLDNCGREGKTCAKRENGVTLCALSSEPDARCLAGAPFAQVCGGASLLECIGEGFLVGEQACELGCISPSEGRAYCPQAAVSHARCTVAGDGDWFCDGESHYVCRGGLALELQDCAKQSQRCAIDLLGRAQCTSSWSAEDDAGAP